MRIQNILSKEAKIFILHKLNCNKNPLKKNYRFRFVSELKVCLVEGRSRERKKKRNHVCTFLKFKFDQTCKKIKKNITITNKIFSIFQAL